MENEEAKFELLRIPPVVAEPRTAQVTPDSDDEAAQLGSGLSSAQLKRQAENAEHGRSERFKNHFEKIAVVALYGVALVFAFLGLIWFWHLIMPAGLRWLSADEISRLQNFVTGGIIATIATGHIKKRLG